MACQLIRFLLRAKLQRRAIFNETRSALYFFRDTVYGAVYVMTRGLAYATRRLRDKNCVVTRDLFTTRTNDARFVYARVKNCAARLRAPAGHALAILRHFVSSCRGVRRCGTGNQSDSCHVTSGCHSGSGFIMGVAILVSGRHLVSGCHLVSDHRHLGFRSPSFR